MIWGGGFSIKTCNRSLSSPQVYDMIWGGGRSCKESWCPVCHPKDNVSPGLCSANFTTGTFRTEKGSGFEAFDPTHPDCDCQSPFIDLWRVGQWVKDLKGFPTCRTDPRASEDALVGTGTGWLIRSVSERCQTPVSSQ